MVNTIAGLISFYGYILTSPLGFIGHVCSLITFSSKTLSLTSTALLFIFLALSDIVYLFMYIYDFIAITLQVPTVSNVNLCHFRTFILNFSTFTASWILVLIALDRFIRARFPFRQARLCTRKVAVCAVGILYICAIAFTYHVLQPELAFVIPGTNLCQPTRFPPTSYSIFFYNVWPSLQLILTYFIPSGLMILCAIGSYTKVNAQQNMMGPSRRREKLQRQMLILMISSISCFIIFTWPFSIFLIVSIHFGISLSSIQANILSIFLSINYCYNFYIHCLTSRLFRQTFIEQLKRFYKWCKRPKNNTVHPIVSAIRVPVQRS
jgi:hypothetical protein